MTSPKERFGELIMTMSEDLVRSYLALCRSMLLDPRSSRKRKYSIMRGEIAIVLEVGD